MKLAEVLVKLAVFGPEEAQTVSRLAERYKPGLGLRAAGSLSGVAEKFHLMEPKPSFAVGGKFTGLSLPAIDRRQIDLLRSSHPEIFDNPAVARQAESFSAPGLRGNVDRFKVRALGFDKPQIAVDRGAAENLFKRRLSEEGRTVKPLSGQESEMFHNIVQGHELDELKGALRRSPATAGMGHTDPRVIYREHNRLMSLPKEYENVGDYFRGVRNIGSENKSLFGAVDPRLSYGTGERFSRHAIRRLSTVAETQAAAEAASTQIARTPEHRWLRNAVNLPSPPSVSFAAATPEIPAAYATGAGIGEAFLPASRDIAREGFAGMKKHPFATALMPGAAAASYVGGKMTPAGTSALAAHPSASRALETGLHGARWGHNRMLDIASGGMSKRMDSGGEMADPSFYEKNVLQPVSEGLENIGKSNPGSYMAHMQTQAAQAAQERLADRAADTLHKPGYFGGVGPPQPPADWETIVSAPLKTPPKTPPKTPLQKTSKLSRWLLSAARK